MERKLLSTSRSLPIALLRARERVMQPIRTILGTVGITEQQWRVLRVLQENGPLVPTQIAREACLLLPSLTRILQKLEEKRLIRRERSRSDGRKQVVQITREGEALILANLSRTVMLMEEMRQRVGTEKYDQLLDPLNHFERIEAQNQRQTDS